MGHQENRNPKVIAKRAFFLLEEWHNFQAPKPVKMPTLKERWVARDEGWMKVNTDGAMAKSEEAGGGGLVVRDHDGRFLAWACHFVPLHF
jgi:hypothetical protein